MSGDMFFGPKNGGTAGCPPNGAPRPFAGSGEGTPHEPVPPGPAAGRPARDGARDPGVLGQPRRVLQVARADRGRQAVDLLRGPTAVSYTHLRAHETRHDLVCR